MHGKQGGVYCQQESCGDVWKKAAMQGKRDAVHSQQEMFRVGLLSAITGVHYYKVQVHMSGSG